MADDELPPDFDIYGFLSISSTATDAEIRKAYRKLSLLYHPDKNPDPAAKQKFHYLQKAQQVLLSETARAAYDNVRKARAAKAERSAKYDNERRRMQQDLENREREAKRRKFDATQRAYGAEEEERIFKMELEKLKEESERLKRERDKRIQEDLVREQELRNADEIVDESQRTIKVKFRKGVDRSVLSVDFLEDLFSKYGYVENVILGKSALVVFETVSAAQAAVSTLKENRKASEMIKDITLVKVELNGDVKESEERVKEAPPVQRSQKPPSAAPKFNFKPKVELGNADYESITLMRMRKLERERLEKDIREQEEKEESEKI